VTGSGARERERTDRNGGQRCAETHAVMRVS
jgi:hypothetical protein